MTRLSLLRLTAATALALTLMGAPKMWAADPPAVSPVAAPAAVDLSSLSAPQQAAVRALVRDEIQHDADLMLHSIATRVAMLQNAQNILVDPARVALIHTAAGRPAFGPASGIPITVFSDPDCPYCRLFAPVFVQFLNDHPDVRGSIVSLGIITHASRPAAIAETALDRVNPTRAWELYTTIEGQSGAEGALDAAAVEQIGARLNLTPAPVTPADVARVDANLTLATSIHVEGTPTIVIGNRVMRGKVDLAAMNQAVAEARAGGAHPPTP